MNFCFLSVNPVKLLWLILASAMSALALVPGLSVLNKNNSFLCAGVVTILFFGGGWAFFQIVEKVQELTCVTISPTALIEVNQLTGVRRQYPFSGITDYRFLPAFRGIATLHLTLSGGERIKLNASDMSLLDNSNAAQFELMVQAFKAAWERYKQANEGSLAGS